MLKFKFFILFFYCSNYIYSQNIQPSYDYMNDLTFQWEGDRFDDGRPKVPDELLLRLENCTLEQIWGFLLRKGFRNQVVTDWVILKENETMTGRALTAEFMPARPDLDSVITKYGILENLSQSGGKNIWPIDALSDGDIYVADGFGKIKDGTLIGSSLGNAIVGRSHKGVVFDGSVRDMQELYDTENFNAWIVGSDPSFIRDMLPVAINKPIRIRSATVFPGDAVFANNYGVAFIPAFLLNDLVIDSEMEGLKDEFERYMLQLGTYDGGQIHGKWSSEIENLFKNWFQKYPKSLHFSLDDMLKYLNR